MNIGNVYHIVIRMIVRIWKAIFYLFSAFMLYAFIAVCIHFLMNALGASGKTIDVTLIIFTGLVILYVIGKTYYLISTWLKKHRHSDLDDLNAQRQQNAQNTTQAQNQTRVDPTGNYPSKSNDTTYINSNRQKPIEPVKAGNFRW